MKLEMNPELGVGYRSRCQIARRVTEDWGERNLFCMACPNDRLSGTPPNTHVFDFQCLNCAAKYQLKSGAKWSERTVRDSAYRTMIESIRADRAPHLLVLQYTPTWTVRNLLLVPSFFFNETVIRKRAALSPTARRAGWVGCDIALSDIAPQGKLRVVREGEALSTEAIRDAFRRPSALASVPPQSRGWTLDVLRMVQQLPRRDFTLDDAYTFEQELQRLYPANHNVRPKIRQQLQMLRDKGFLQFTGRGRYRVLD